MPSKASHRLEELTLNPRSHVNKAKFYDWSKGLLCDFSASGQHEDVSGTSRTPQDKRPEGNTFLTATGEINPRSSSEISSRHYLTNSGRMFIRDKKMLTRGEREIIQGIYKNRGDVITADTLGKSEFQVKCHKDAWYVGKSNYRSLGIGKTLKGENIDYEHLNSCCHVNINKSCASSASGEPGLVDTTSHIPQSRTGSVCPNNKSQRGKVLNSAAILPFLKCVICRANRDELEKAKIKMSASCQDHYCSGSLVVPPGAPDPSNLYNWMQQHPLLYKLLDLRPSLPLGSTFLAGKTPVRHSNYELFSGCKKQREDFCHNYKTKPCFQCFPVLLNWVSDDLSACSVESPSASSGRARNIIPKTHKIQNKESCGAVNHTNCELMKSHCDYCFRDSDDTSDEQGEGSDETGLNKRLKVTVYVPTAEPDHTDDLMPAVASPNQRPLNKRRQFKTLKLKKKVT